MFDADRLKDDMANAIVELRLSAADDVSSGTQPKRLAQPAGSRTISGSISKPDPIGEINFEGDQLILLFI